MDAFWTFARRMLRYRLILVVAIAMAFASAGSLGAGLVGLKPVMENILGTSPKDLPALAQELNQTSWVNGRIPQAWIAALPSGPFIAVVWILTALGLLTILGGIANFLHAYLALTIVQRTVANIRREAFHRVLRLPLKEVVSGGTADKVSRIVGDASTLEAGFNALISKALAQFTKGIAGYAAAIIIEWRLALAATLLAPVLFGVIRGLGKRIRKASRSALQSSAGLYGAATEALQGLRVVKVHTTERYEAGRFHRINKEVMRQMLRARTARALSTPLVEVLTIWVIGAIALVAANFVLSGTIKPNDLFLELGALGMAGASFRPLTGLVNDIQTASGAAVRIHELLDLKPEPGHESTLARMPRHSDSIEFRRVTFSYPGALRPALDAVTLRIARGERIAIVGPNGSGKTTLLSLVPRLFDPQEGSVLIDGRDIKEFNVRSIRRQIAVVTQETVLFRGTIWSNIAYGADEAGLESVASAARKARADGFIEGLPGAYDAAVGEQGLTLSGGQRQRVAIARAILRNPSILVLDEATSMIDADSEAKIAEALNEFASGRTCLIVAHRLSTVVGADRIVVMDQGRIVDQGSHAQLLQRCSVYRLIAENQLLKEGPERGRGETGGGMRIA